GAQFGITVTSLITGFIAEPSIAALLRGPLQSAGLPEATSAVVAFASAFMIATIAQMIFGELIPKNWAIAEPLRVGRAVVSAQRFFTWIFKPLIWFFNGTANVVVRMFGIEPQEELASAREPQELASLAVRSAQRGLLGEQLARRLDHSVTLHEHTASDAMTPRPKVHFLDEEDSVADVLRLCAETGHARFPIYRDTVDQIVGGVHFKDALAVPAGERATTPAASLIRPVPAVPSTMPLGSVLEIVRNGLQMALVVDEYGGTDGMVTLEDIVEEIVGEIDDEQDRPTRAYRQLGEGRWALSGLMRPDEAGESVGLQLPEARESDTLGGLMTERLERFPRVGDEVVLRALDESQPDDVGLPQPVGVRLRVTRLDGFRVDRMLLTVEDEVPSAQEENNV
nr:HlyC/CorC family transporter [Actinomycetales bacterium]